MTIRRIVAHCPSYARPTASARACYSGGVLSPPKPTAAIAAAIATGEALAKPTKGETYARAQQVLQAATPEAAKALVGLLDDEDSKVRLAAAEAILNRTLGRPKPAEDDAPDATSRLTVLVGQLSVGQLVALATGQPAQQEALPVPDATPPGGG